MKNKIYKIIFFSIIFIFMINIINSYAAKHWNDFSLSDYKNAKPEEAGQLAGYLGAVTVENLSKEDLEKYIKCANAFTQTEAARMLDIGILQPIKTNVKTAEKIKEGTNNDDDSNEGGSNIYDSSWGNYISRKDEIRNAATKEDGQRFYKMLVNPTPSLDNMTDYFAEQYIILVGELLKSPGFTLYSNGDPNARQKLTENMRIAKDKHKIDDEEASKALEESGAETDSGGSTADTAIYKQPELEKGTKNPASNLSDLISDADSFERAGKELQYQEGNLQQVSTAMYNILLLLAVAIALIVGVIVGIKYMVGSVEEKANYKAMLIPYVAGCVVVFGSFGIWKLVITILENI